MKGVKNTCVYTDFFFQLENGGYDEENEAKILCTCDIFLCSRHRVVSLSGRIPCLMIHVFPVNACDFTASTVPGRYVELHFGYSYFRFLQRGLTGLQR